MERILLSHGGGGKDTAELIKGIFMEYLSNPIIERFEDSASLNLEGKLAFTTDSFTVSPPFFKGGDIGKLAVAGTINDLVVSGAEPLYISVAFIIEEGFSIEKLRRILRSMSEELEKNGVLAVAGDTKVVPKGQADGIFITTSGIGRIIYDSISASSLEEGDLIIVSGTVGDHGAVILAHREGLDIDINSDCGSVWGIVEKVFESDAEIHAMRDPTRGGIAQVLNEWAEMSSVLIEIWEDKIPVKEGVMGLCDLFGFEPYHLANEGMVVMAVKEGDAERVVEILRSHPMGREASIIGRVVAKGKKGVVIKTPYGTGRILHHPEGELLPRIC